MSDLTSQIPHLKPEYYAIIVAGGMGNRMQSVIPKQFLLLNGLPVLMHTIGAFHQSNTQPRIIVVMHPDSHEYWNKLCADYNFDIPYQLINGGETRFNSVKNGIEILDDDNALVAIHDAVRPLITTDIIDAGYQHARQYGNAITAVKSRDSVRQVKENRSAGLVRENIYLVQTPQTFQAVQLKTAYLQHYHSNFTDDSSVIESAGFDIHLVEGSYQNIKITFPEDIVIAEALLKRL